VRELTMVQALNEAMKEEMRRDPKVYVIGEAVGKYAMGMSRVTSGLEEEFGPERVRDTGIVECLIGGSCVGAALAGYRPVADYMRADFMFPALDEVLVKAGLWRHEHGAAENMSVPLVFRASIGGYGGGGSEHMRAPNGLFMHAPGLKIVLPTNPYDAKGLLKTAIRDDNPVVFLEHRLCYPIKGPVPEEEYLIPFGVADIRREGTDCTIVATAYQVVQSLQAAEELAKEGISAEVIDPRTLEPLDIDTIVASVRKTGRCVIVDEDYIRCSVASEIGFQIQEQALDTLKAPIQRVGNPNVSHVTAPPLVKAILPNPEKIADAVRATLRVATRA